jgi:CheY-like chemotaxis protein
MKAPTLNLRDLSVAVCDPNSYIRRLLTGTLRGFGASKIFEIDSSTVLQKVLSHQKIDMLLCDARLQPVGGLDVAKAIRNDPNSENRTIPILILSSDTRDIIVKAARDAGANMVIAKPFSPKTLYQKLSWLAMSRRPFIDTATYFGPERRFKIEGYPGGVGRRAGDKPIEVAAEAGPAMGQNDIDNLFSAAQLGRSE